MGTIQTSTHLMTDEETHTQRETPGNDIPKFICVGDTTGGGTFCRVELPERADRRGTFRAEQPRFKGTISSDHASFINVNMTPTDESSLVIASDGIC